MIELVTSVTVLALIIGPLTTATVLFLEHGRDPVGVFADDGTIRAATALFVADVESAGTVTAPDTGPCGSTEPALLTTTWDDRGTVYRASWFAIPASTFTTIVRRRCTGTSLISTVVVGDVAGAPSIACTPSCNAPTTLTLSGISASGSVFTVAAPRRAP